MKNFFFTFSLLILFACNRSEKETSSNNSTKKNEKTKVNVPSLLNPYANLSYSIINERKAYSLKNDSIKKIINEFCETTEDLNVGALIDFILDLTKEQLTFSFDKCKSAPDELIKTRKANCIGYAAYFNSLMNYGLHKKGLSKRYKCRHYVGKIYFAGKNIHQLFNDPFFKDHDFNIIKDLESGTEVAVDPSLYEYLHVKRVAIKK